MAGDRGAGAADEHDHERPGVALRLEPGVHLTDELRGRGGPLADQQVPLLLDVGGVRAAGRRLPHDRRQGGNNARGDGDGERGEPRGLPAARLRAPATA